MLTLLHLFKPVYDLIIHQITENFIVMFNVR